MKMTKHPMRFKTLLLILILLIPGTQAFCSEVDTVLSDVEKKDIATKEIQNELIQ